MPYQLGYFMQNNLISKYTNVWLPRNEELIKCKNCIVYSLWCWIDPYSPDRNIGQTIAQTPYKQLVDGQIDYSIFGNVGAISEMQKWTQMVTMGNGMGWNRGCNFEWMWNALNDKFDIAEYTKILTDTENNYLVEHQCLKESEIPTSICTRRDNVGKDVTWADGGHYDTFQGFKTLLSKYQSTEAVPTDNSYKWKIKHIDKPWHPKALVKPQKYQPPQLGETEIPFSELLNQITVVKNGRYERKISNQDGCNNLGLMLMLKEMLKPDTSNPLFTDQSSKIFYLQKHFETGLKSMEKLSKRRIFKIFQ